MRSKKRVNNLNRKSLKTNRRITKRNTKITKRNNNKSKRNLRNNKRGGMKKKSSRKRKIRGGASNLNTFNSKKAYFQKLIEEQKQKPPSNNHLTGARHADTLIKISELNIQSKNTGTLRDTEFGKLNSDKLTKKDYYNFLFLHPLNQYLDHDKKIKQLSPYQISKMTLEELQNLEDNLRKSVQFKLPNVRPELIQENKPDMSDGEHKKEKNKKEKCSWSTINIRNLLKRSYDEEKVELQELLKFLVNDCSIINKDNFKNQYKFMDEDNNNNEFDESNDDEVDDNEPLKTITESSYENYINKEPNMDLRLLILTFPVYYDTSNVNGWEDKLKEAYKKLHPPN